MGNPTSQLTHGLHLLRLQEIQFQGRFVGHVAPHANEPQGLAIQALRLAEGCVKEALVPALLAVYPAATPMLFGPKPALDFMPKAGTELLTDFLHR